MQKHHLQFRHDTLCLCSSLASVEFDIASELVGLLYINSIKQYTGTLVQYWYSIETRRSRVQPNPSLWGIKRVHTFWGILFALFSQSGTWNLAITTRWSKHMYFVEFGAAIYHVHCSLMFPIFHDVDWFTQSCHQFFHSVHWGVHGFDWFFHGFNGSFHA